MRKEHPLSMETCIHIHSGDFSMTKKASIRLVISQSLHGKASLWLDSFRLWGPAPDSTLLIYSPPGSRGGGGNLGVDWRETGVVRERENWRERQVCAFGDG